MPGKNTSVGKLPKGELEKLLALASTVRRPSTILGPAVGEDAGVVDLGSCLLVAHTDPITEASKGSGSLAVIVASNDVAATGARPRWIQLVILLPPDAPASIAEELMQDAAMAARKLGLEILGGHTERSPGITRPVIVAFAYGCACKQCLTPTGGARQGDRIAIVGWAGLEGMKILANDFPEVLLDAGVPRDVVDEAANFPVDVSIVDIAVDIAESGIAHAMHDATEGGVLGALVEMALASGKTIVVDRDKIPVPGPLEVIAEKTGIDPLRLISSGALIISLDSSRIQMLENIVSRHNRPASIVGYVEEGPGQVILRGRGEVTILREPPEDEISRFWGGTGRG